VAGVVLSSCTTESQHSKQPTKATSMHAWQIRLANHLPIAFPLYCVCIPATSATAFASSDPSIH
jgi:hypothetical protein